MEQEDRETLQHISDTLDEMLLVLKKPANKVIIALEVSAAIVSILAIIFIIEAILRWIFGG